MSARTLPTGAIAVPYTPDDCLDEYGWIWTNAHRGDPAEWHLVSTHLPDGIDAEPVVTFHEADGCHPLDEDAADTWAGCPYLPMVAPKGGPSAGLEVTVRLEAGATATVTYEDRGERTKRLRREVLALLTDDEGNALIAAHEALRACLAVLYGTLRTDLESFVAGTPTGDPAADGIEDERSFIEPQVSAIRLAEAVVGRDMLPDDTPTWLAAAIDTWRFAEGTG